MRNISFALTEQQVLAQTKDVTRRVSWLHAKEGDLLQPVRKCMGLKRGEGVVMLGQPVRLLLRRRERLDRLVTYADYGWREVAREGFPDMQPADFVKMFCDTHRGCTPASEITRLEFSYDLLNDWRGMHTAPKDGSEVELLVRHLNWLYARTSEERDRWQAPVRAQWIDFNGGGWTWRGHAGEAIAWRPAC